MSWRSVGPDCIVIITTVINCCFYRGNGSIAHNSIMFKRPSNIVSIIHRPISIYQLHTGFYIHLFKSPTPNSIDVSHISHTIRYTFSQKKKEEKFFQNLSSPIRPISLKNGAIQKTRRSVQSSLLFF